MDTEEHIEIQKALSQGHPPTDEGPYYHEPWWESYKGGNKGYLGGMVAYSVIGGIVGVASAAALFFTGLVEPVAIVPIISGITAAGMLYGLQDFHDIGKIVGSGAAIAEKQEERSNKKFKSLEKKIDELKAMVAGKKADAAAETATGQTAAEPAAEHRTTHIGDHAARSSQPIFWKVAAVGLLFGLAAGALLAGGGMAEMVLHHLGVAGTLHLEGASLFAATMIPLGLFGASFGINRDIFRHIFDKTDLWFKGLFSNDVEISRQKSQYIDKSKDKSEHAPIVTMVYPHDMVDLPASDTHFRDKRKAEQALLKLDPSKTIRQ